MVRRSLIEVLLIWLLVALRIWVPWFHFSLPAGTGWLIVALAFVISAQTSRARALMANGVSPIREMGFRVDNLGRSFFRLLPFVVASLAIIALLSVTGKAGPRCPVIPLRYILYFLWALVQQYLLQAFVVLRLCDLKRGPIATSFVAGVIFASLHLPNPALTIATLLGGWILSHNFLTCHNIFAVSLAHGIVAASMECFLPQSILRNMYVGIFYLLWTR